jgi:UDP-3-O-[3-hydroxymyristoyl] glucosamine N-acyltransferase
MELYTASKLMRKSTIYFFPSPNAGANIGSNCIINSKALIEHDAIIGDHCHIATGAIINGGTVISPKTFVGSNAVCKEYIEIGENAVIGCGAKITKNIL